jgi:membrane associated rhomboid family serine protease
MWFPYIFQPKTVTTLMPISDDNRSHHHRPYVNYALIALNVLVFVVLQQGGANLFFTYAFSMVPAEILTGTDSVTHDQLMVDPYTGQRFNMPGLQPTPIPVYFTMITSMFMHGGWGHLLGIMLYLYIFGDNLEHRMGRSRYLLFYLICGVLASLAHVFSSFMIPDTAMIPSLGATVAISGVLRGNIILFPKRKVNVLLGWIVVQVPLLLSLGLWIALQVVSSLGTLGGQSDGVAYAAHIGGFIAGMLLVKFFDRGPVESVQHYRRR